VLSGKVVTKLEYTSYSKLAIKTMANIIRSARTSAVRNDHAASTQPHYTSSLVKCAVYHRLGTVPVGEPSIIIAVSSPHRKEAFVACEYILEEVKAKAQIWKREHYEGEEDDTAEWKANRA
jgi:molybdopterin synthase catalytic subunit